MREAKTAWIGAAGVFLAACGFHAWYAFYGVSDYDEGLLLDGAARVLRGETYGGDFHAPYGPGRYYLLAAWWKLFGSSVATYRGLTVLVQALADALVFRIVARRSSWTGALCSAALLAVAHGSLFKSFLLLTLVLILAAADLIDRDGGSAGAGRRRWLGAGALLGLACVFRYDIGVFAVAALGASCVLVGSPAGASASGAGRRGSLVRIAWLCVGCAGPILLVASALTAAGASPVDWWQQTRVFLGAQMRIRPDNPPLFGPDGPGPLENWLLWAAIVGSALCCVGQVAGVVARRMRRAPLEGDVFRLGVALFSLVLFNQLRLMVTLNRLFQIAAPIIVLLADLLARRGRRIVGQGALVVLTLAVIVWVHQTTKGLHPGAYTARNAEFVHFDIPRAGVKVARGTSRNLTKLIETIHAEVPEGESIHIALRPQVAAYLADRPLALPYAAACFYLTNEDAQRAAIARLEQARPRLYIEDPRPIMWFTLEQDAPLMQRYFENHYERPQRIGPYTVWRRRP
ncbi:MAG: glycosyltransferase family 39 protein [Planctomycetota bacterium]